ncbi:hypothetical protein BDV12DRAFT_208748 [Aspergillus spectabilis]
MEPIAIIGLSIKFPRDADTPEGFWRMLEEKQSAMEEWPKDRINLEAFVHRESKLSPNAQNFVAGAHFMKEDCGRFDAPFFGISGAEASAIDPQSRLLLETAYQALENAGIPMEKTHGSNTSVFTGCMADDYKHLINHDPEHIPKYAATGATACMLSNRVSWFFNLQGPSVTLDSACSSSLLALDLACLSLRNNESDMALVAGSNIILAPQPILSLMNMNFTNPQGRCFTFDSRANGYGRGEGVGVLLIKKLERAIQDSNTIRAVIRSTGSNQDGRTPGLTQPKKESQARLIVDTYEKAGLDLSHTRFFEAHGTGTLIGDSTEVEAVGSVFRTSRSADEPLYLGAVKSNIGHLEGASGIAGIVKAVLVLEKGLIPPNTNFETISPSLDVDFYNIKIPTTMTPWPTTGLRRASVASFGYGGTNSHAVLDDAYHFLKERGLCAAHCTVEEPGLRRSNGPLSATVQVNPVPQSLNGDTPVPNPSCSPQSRLFVWSTEDELGIQRMIKAYRGFFETLAVEKPSEDGFLEQLVTTLALKRSQLQWRAFAVADSLEALKDLQHRVTKPVRIRSNLALGYMFTGQGAQYHGMARDLLVYTVFRDTLARCQEAFASFGCAWSIFELLSREDGAFDIDDPEYAQPLTTAVQISLVNLLFSFSPRPQVVIGHSSGEVAAAYAAGGLSIFSACKVSYFRGSYASRLRKTNPAAAMLAVHLSEASVEPYVSRVRDESNDGQLCIACINSPSNVTISGEARLIDLLKSRLDQDNIPFSRLKTGVAYHSPRMSQIAAEYEDAISGITAELAPQRNRVTMVSSVTGKPVDELAILSRPAYWVQNLCSPVQFSAAIMASLLQQAEPRKNKVLGAQRAHFASDWLEIGPHSTLQRPFSQILEHCHAGGSKVHGTYRAVLDRHSSAVQTLQHAMGTLHAFGYAVALDLVNRSRPRASGLEHILVTLPPYPFNHTKRYWHEPQTARNIRLSPERKLEFLGAPAPESTAAESRWRKVFDPSQSPWLLDHAVNGQPIYAGTAMIVMALEGVRQLADKGRDVTGFLMHDAVFLNPISFSPFSRTESNLYVRPSRYSFEGSSHSYDFRIYTQGRDQWLLNCWGQVSIQYASRARNTDAEAAREMDYFTRRLEDARQDCSQPITAEKMYKTLEENGLSYGPSFRIMDDIYWNGAGDAICDIRILPLSATQSHTPVDTHIIHPVTLDGLGQLGWVAFTHGGEKAITRGLVATRVREAWLAGSGAAFPETQRLKAYAHTRFKGTRGTDTAAFAVDSTSGELKVWIAGMETASMTSHNLHPGQGQSEGRRALCYSIDWKPDFGCLTAEQVRSYCGRADNAREPVEFLRCLERLMVLYIRKSLAMGGLKTTSGTVAPHLQKYVIWLERCIDMPKAAHQPNDAVEELPPVAEPETSQDIASLEKQLTDLSAEAEIYLTVGQNLTAIINGTTSPLQLLYGNGPAAAYYQSVCGQLFDRNRVDRYIKALAHHNPRMKILEVGAGTGSLTSLLLQVLTDGQSEDMSPAATSTFLRYDYTDVSEAFFEEARERYSAFGQRIVFKTFDVERDPAGQGFECGTYDLLVAVWVMHVARNVRSALRNVRKLLKPDGKLLLLEVVKPDVSRGTFVFGTLPGWWTENEVARGQGPGASEEEWGQLLQANGFTGADLIFRDYEAEECRWSSLIVSSATGADVAPNVALVDCAISRRILFVIYPESHAQRQLVELVVARDPHGLRGVEVCSVYDLTAASVGGSPFVVFLCEIERPLLSGLDEMMFGALQGVLYKAQDVLWVTAAAPDTLQSAHVHIVDGLARVLSSENDRLSFITAHLQDHHTRPDLWATHILHLITDRLNANGKAAELEYREMHGMLCIGRVREATSLNNRLFDQIQTPLKLRPFKQEKPLVSVVNNTGLLDPSSVVFTEDPEPATALGPEEIEIEVRSVGVNFRDVFVLLGRMTDSCSIGVECSGVVTRVGAACFSFQSGDRVCAVSLSCLRTRVRVNAHLAIRIPDSLDFVVAASVPAAGITAHYALVKVARLERGESVLIHSGAGATGQMAVQVALALGAEIFVTVGTDEKSDLLQSLYGIPESHIFCSRDVSFQRHIIRVTEGRGVDVVLNSIAGDGLVASWECVAPYGRFVELGKSDLEANSKLPMSRFMRNVSFSAVAFDQIVVERPALVRESLEAVMAFIRDGKLSHPQPLQEFPLSACENAYRLLQSGKSAGKLIINLNPTDLVQTYLRHSPSYTFPPDATYVLAGGLGGLGRSTAHWMASLGAKNLILLSRSGPQSDAAQRLLGQLEGQGVRVAAPRCDVTSSDALASVLQECRDWPPIRGCIQGTMVLQDSIFEILTFQQWDKTLQAKVKTTQNLHEQLPPDLDFFILLSSMAGIVGSISQANYAAGNTFQDAFSSYRRSIGQRAASIDLGYMTDVGIIAETESYASRAQQLSDLGSVRESEFLALLEFYCDPALEHTRTNRQVLVGVVSPAQLLARGIQPPTWLQERNLFHTLPLEQGLRDAAGLQSAAGATAASTVATTADYRNAFKQAGSASAATTVVMNGLAQKLSRALGVAVEEIDMQRSLALQGVDSLLAVDLRLWISRSFDADVSALDIVGAANVEEIVGLVVARSAIGGGWKDDE